MRFGQFDERRRTINDAHDSDGRVLARQLFEAAAKHWINRENRDGDHECLGLLQWPRRHYFTGRSPMTTLSATGVPPRIKLRSTVRPTLSGPSKRMISRTRSIGWPYQAVTISPTSIPARAEGPSGSRFTTRTPRPLSKDCPPFDAGLRFTGWRLAPR